MVKKKEKNIPTPTRVEIVCTRFELTVITAILRDRQAA
jgi:hypothetical protein